MLTASSAEESSSGAPPRITQHPISRQVIKNEPITLDCRAEGSPQPEIEWFRNEGEPVRQIKQYEFKSRVNMHFFCVKYSR